MRIGIPGSITDGVFGASSKYMDFIAIVGTPVILSPGDFPKDIDGVLLPGGSDVDTGRYSHNPGFFTGWSNPYLEHFDTKILPNIIGKIPVFGICRGLQTLNVLLGGTLKQHLWFHPYSGNDEDLVHTVEFPGLNTLIPGNKFDVNSFHHQAIDKLGKGIKVEMVSDDKLVEVISGDKFFAVQWHPERMRDEYSTYKFMEVMNQ